jgi:hypothetical protein
MAWGLLGVGAGAELHWTQQELRRLHAHGKREAWGKHHQQGQGRV